MLVWLHLHGPDGNVVMLADYDSRRDMYCLIEDGYTECFPTKGADGNTWVHKWVIVKVEEVTKPVHCASL